MKGTLNIRPMGLELTNPASGRTIYLEVKVGDEFYRSKPGTLINEHNVQWKDDHFQWNIDHETYLIFRISSEGVVFDEVIGETGILLTYDVLSDKRTKHFEFFKNLQKNATLRVELDFKNANLHIPIPKQALAPPIPGYPEATSPEKPRISDDRSPMSRTNQHATHPAMLQKSLSYNYGRPGQPGEQVPPSGMTSSQMKVTSGGAGVTPVNAGRTPTYLQQNVPRKELIFQTQAAHSPAPGHKH